MGGSANLEGFPPVIRLYFWQGSDERPGRLVIDTAIDTPSAVPMHTDLTMFARGQTFFWPNMRVVKSPRVFRGYMRTVLEDSRWTLRNTILSGNYNKRDKRGIVEAATLKTEKELWTLLGTEAGISIVCDPEILKPLAAWNGTKGDKIANMLLKSTVTRMIYDPTTQVYKISKAGDGSLPGLNQRLYKPGPDETYKNIHVDIGPTLYEQQETCDAMIVDSDWNPEKIADSGYPDNAYFDGYKDESDIPLRYAYTSGAYRIWKIRSSTDKHFIDGRAMSIQSSANGGVDLKIYPYDTDIYDWHRASAYYKTGRVTLPVNCSLIEKDNIIVTEEPVIKSSAGAISTECDFVIAHNKIADGVFTRKRLTSAVGEEGGDIVINVDYLHGYTSTIAGSEASEDASVTTEHTEIRARHLARLTAKRQLVKVGTLLPTGGSGQVGAVLYRMSSEQSRKYVDTQVSFNFVPSSPESS